jgi:hypothetical protein
MKVNKILILAAIIIAGIILVNLASALTLISVSTNPAEVSPGERASLDLTLKNNLDDDVTDVTIGLDLANVPFAPYQSSSQVNFDEILEDKSKYINFNLIVDSDAESGTYKIPVKISYILDDEKKESSGLVSLIVVADAKLDLSVDNSILIKGENSDLSIKIINSGLGGARLLSIEIKQANGIRNLGSAKDYIGDIDSDDFDSAIFKVSISENAPSMINLPVEINYRDSRNNEIKESKTLTLTAYTTEQAIQLGLIKKSNIGIIISSIVVLIILFLIYRTIRKRLKKKRLEQEG